MENYVNLSEQHRGLGCIRGKRISQKTCFNFREFNLFNIN